MLHYFFYFRMETRKYCNIVLTGNKQFCLMKLLKIVQLLLVVTHKLYK